MGGYNSNFVGDSSFSRLFPHPFPYSPDVMKLEKLAAEIGAARDSGLKESEYADKMATALKLMPSFNEEEEEEDEDSEDDDSDLDDCGGKEGGGGK